MDTLALLSRLVAIDSVFPNEQKISLFLKSYLSKLGLKVQTVSSGKNRLNIVATYGKSSSYISFYSHSDTVPVATGWKYDPFLLKVIGGRAHGLGASDMKGGLVSILKTAQYAVVNKLPIKIIIAVDEENISQGAHDLVNSGLLKDVGCIISAESGQITDLSKPYSVVFGRLGHSLFDISIKGQTAHAAEAHKGTNAIHNALKFIDVIEKSPLPTEQYLGKPRLLLNSIHATTSAFSVPDICHLQYSLLSNSKLSDSDFIALVKKCMKRNKIKGSIGLHPRTNPYGKSYTLNVSHPFIKKITKEIFDIDKVIPTYAQSISDENIFASRLKIPVIVIGPIRGNAHRAHEWVKLNSIENVFVVYKKLLHMYLLDTK